MSALLKNIRIATLATAALSVVCCGLYPAVVYGLAQVIFPRQANGSLIVDSSGTIRGSHLLGQSFTSDRYFHPRPSSAGSGCFNLAAALLFGASAPLAKLLLGEVEPIPLAAFLYLGSGIGLFGIKLFQRINQQGLDSEAQIQKPDYLRDAPLLSRCGP